jgi:hypothetical protein
MNFRIHLGELNLLPEDFFTRIAFEREEIFKRAEFKECKISLRSKYLTHS